MTLWLIGAAAWAAFALVVLGYRLSRKEIQVDSELFEFLFIFAGLGAAFWPVSVCLLSGHLISQFLEFCNDHR